MVLVQGRESGSGATRRGYAPSMASTHPLCQVLEALKGIRQGETAYRWSRITLPCLIFGESEAEFLGSMLPVSPTCPSAKTAL